MKYKLIFLIIIFGSISAMIIAMLLNKKLPIEKYNYKKNNNLCAVVVQIPGIFDLLALVLIFTKLSNLVDIVLDDDRHILLYSMIALSVGVVYFAVYYFWTFKPFRQRMIKKYNNVSCDYKEKPWENPGEIILEATIAKVILAYMSAGIFYNLLVLNIY